MAYTSEMLTDAEVRDYLGIDVADDHMVNSNVAMMKAAAAAYLNGAVGTNGDMTDPRSKILALAVISDMYDNRGINDSSKVSAATRKLVSDFALQLRLESRGVENA